MDTAGVVRSILLVDMVVMALLSVIYLRQRRLNWIEYCGWGLLALLVPVIGPFLVIANRPGEWDPDFSLPDDFRRVGQYFNRLLPTAPPRPKLSRLDRARLRRRQRREQNKGR